MLAMDEFAFFLLQISSKIEAFYPYRLIEGR